MFRITKLASRPGLTYAHGRNVKLLWYCGAPSGSTRSSPSPKSFDNKKSTTSYPPKQYIPFSLDYVEDIERYAPGGFHPVHLGDVFNERYEVLQKLGYGGFSTVWLAVDTASRQYVALKIVTAHESRDCSELRILQLLAKVLRSTRGSNGIHVCLVLHAAGPSIAAFNYAPGQLEVTRRLPDTIARNIAKQTALALDYLHSVQFVQFNHWTTQENLERFGEPIKDPISTADGNAQLPAASRYIVEPISIRNSEYLSNEIQLVDFGQAFTFGEPPAADDVGITFCYASPEVIFDSSLSRYSDIWALGCVLFVIRAGQGLFSEFFDGEDEVVIHMVQTLGKLPKHWWDAWGGRKELFDEDGKPIATWEDGRPRMIEFPLKTIVADIGSEDTAVVDEIGGGSIVEPSGTRLSQEEIEQLTDLLSSVLKWVPEERSSLKEVLSHPWLQLDKA